MPDWRLTEADLERIIGRYDEVVRGNTTDDYDAIAAVIEDEDDEVGYEAISVAADVLDFEPTTAENDRIYDAAQTYRERLRKERSSWWLMPATTFDLFAELLTAGTATVFGRDLDRVVAIDPEGYVPGILTTVRTVEATEAPAQVQVTMSSGHMTISCSVDVVPLPASTVTALPFTARFCATCDTWIYTAAGPFAEGDETKTLADLNHVERLHPELCTGFGRPFMRFNDETVEAVMEPVG